VSADSVARGFAGGNAEIQFRAYVPAVRSLQQHATEALWTIERVCVRAPSVGRAYLGVVLDVFMRTDSTENIPVSAIPYPRVVQVERESPAERAGLQAGDRILRMNGVDVRDRDLSEFITRPGATVEVRVRRDAGERVVRAELAAPRQREPGAGVEFSLACQNFVNPAEFTVLFQRDSIASQVLNIPSIQLSRKTLSVAVRKPGNDSATVVARGFGSASFSSGGGVAAVGTITTSVDRWGAVFRAATQSYLQNQGAADGGVPVMFIAPNSIAARAGLEVGDIVVRTGGKQVSTITDFLGAVNSSTSNREASLELEVLRGKAVRKISMPPR
jgi:S1-C subfamily serine protease